MEKAGTGSDRPSGAAVHHHRIHLGKPGKRFPQGPGRQQAAVAEAALAIHHHDFHVPRQGVMLQPVVGQDHIDFGMESQQACPA
jgi:hypothetical protein